MIIEFVKAWDANKQKLSEYIASNEQGSYSNYKQIVKMLFEQVINPYLTANGETAFNLDSLHEIDDGDYQGTLLYMIPKDTYQSSYYEYVATFVGYCSRSGCDTLMGISCYDEGLPNECQVKEYMELCLHILQNCKYPFNYNEED
jgi:hypothetical protein